VFFCLGGAAVVELLSEPLYILAQCLLLLRVRVAIETLATLAKSFVTYALLLRGIGKVRNYVLLPPFPFLISVA
jgi:hypothetical protein